MNVRSGWCELLAAFIVDPLERNRIAKEIGVHPATLTRWVSGESFPRPHNLRQLLYALSWTQRTQMLPFIKKMVPDYDDLKAKSIASEIPYAFLLEVLETRATTADPLRFWSIMRLVLQQALKQLDPERMGMEIIVVRCMPPGKTGKIRSLRETIGLGTPPWSGDLEEKTLLLGAESLAGHATASGHMEQIADLRTNQALLPVYQGKYEVSAVACPLMYGCRVAGCLLFSSTQPNYFLSEVRLALIKGYTHLVALAFDAHDFYSLDMIELHILPPIPVQNKYLAGFRDRVITVMRGSTQMLPHLLSTQAEQLVWQEIEESLIDSSISC